MASLPEVPSDAQVLDFSMNQFTSFPLIPESPSCHFECGVKNSSSHCRLAISFNNNQIKKFESNALNELICLQTLDLSYNNIKADIFRPTLFDEGVYYLQRLNLRGNPLGTLPDNIITEPFMPNLQHLDLSDCKLRQMGRNSVDDFPNLLILDLSYNKLSDIHKDTFKGLKRLNKLDLTNNELTYFSEHTFGDLTNLQDLRLEGNNIKGFHDDAFYEDSPLVNLDLANNRLHHIPYPAINKLLKLKTLDLTGNPILRVSANDTVNSVENLILDDLPLLKEIGMHDLSAFTNLVSLSISGGKGFEKIHRGALSNYSPRLRYVRLEDNWLATLESDALPWKQLETLMLDGNPWLCDDRLNWMIEAECIKGPVICEGPGHLRGHDLKTLKASDLRREVTIIPTAAIIISLLAAPVVCVCVALVWRRRRFCPCSQHELQGRYVSVFTRDGDEESEVRVEVRLKENAKRIVAVSNGGADDTKHLVKFGKGGDTNQEIAYDTEEEEI